MKAKAIWVGKYQFVGVPTSGHGIVIDSSKGTNTGASPMELVLIALGGCTGMDVVSILGKMKKKISKFEVTCEGERAENYPKVYKKINVHYYLEGDGLDEESVKKAIYLSKEKYCSVSAMLSKTAEINFTFEIKETK